MSDYLYISNDGLVKSDNYNFIEVFNKNKENAHSIFFFKGRLKFLTPSGIESKSPAGAPSCLISFSQNMTDKIEKAYLDEKIKGYLWKL